MVTEGSILMRTDGSRDAVPISLVRDTERRPDRETEAPTSIAPVASSQRIRIHAASLDAVLASLATLSLRMHDTIAQLDEASELRDVLACETERLDACTEAVVSRMRLLGASPGEVCDGWHQLQEMLGDAGDPSSSHLVAQLLSSHRSSLAEVSAARALMTRSWGPVDAPTRALLATIERTLQQTFEHLVRHERSERAARVSRIPA